MPSNVPAHRTPRISASRPLAFVAPEDSQSKTYSSTGLWGKRKMTYAELQTVWSEYNENEERCAIGYATSEVCSIGFGVWEVTHTTVGFA